MKIVSDGNPEQLLKKFGYSKCYYQNKPGIKAEHGIFWYNGKKYLIEFVSTVADGQSLRWVVSTVSVFMKPSDRHPEMVYHITEEKMIDSSSRRIALFVVYNGSPLLAICDNLLGVVKVYEMSDLVDGITLRFGSECIRFSPKTYEDMMQKKVVTSFALNKNFFLLEHEQSKEKYDLITSFYRENNLKERLK